MKTFDFAQYSAEWWEARRGVPTASEFDKIVTPAKWSYSTQARGYLCSLIGDLNDPLYGRHEEYVSHAMAAGSALEPHARDYFQFATDTEVRQVGFCLDDTGRVGCSPDGLVGDNVGLELKCPTRPKHVAWLLDGGVPREHLPQIHGSMVVTGFDAWWFMSYCHGLPALLIKVERDEKTEVLAKHLIKFCDEYDAARQYIDLLQENIPTQSQDFGSLGKVEVTHGDASPF